MDTTRFDKYDTGTNTLPNGEPRCERGQTYCDEQIKDFAWARCTSPATLRVRATYLNGNVKEAEYCPECYEDFSQHMGQLGYAAKIEVLGVCNRDTKVREREMIEAIKLKIADISDGYGKGLIAKALAELPNPGPGFVFLTPEQIANLRL